MATKQPNRDPTERMIAVLERIETELRGVNAEAKETNQRLGRVEARLESMETQVKRTPCVVLVAVTRDQERENLRPVPA